MSRMLLWIVISASPLNATVFWMCEVSDSIEFFSFTFVGSLTITVLLLFGIAEVSALRADAPMTNRRRIVMVAAVILFIVDICLYSVGDGIYPQPGDFAIVLSNYCIRNHKWREKNRATSQLVNFLLSFFFMLLSSIFYKMPKQDVELSSSSPSAVSPTTIEPVSISITAKCSACQIEFQYSFFNTTKMMHHQTRKRCNKCTSEERGFVHGRDFPLQEVTSDDEDFDDSATVSAAAVAAAMHSSNTNNDNDNDANAQIIAQNRTFSRWLIYSMLIATFPQTAITGYLAVTIIFYGAIITKVSFWTSQWLSVVSIINFVLLYILVYKPEGVRHKPLLLDDDIMAAPMLTDQRQRRRSPLSSLEESPLQWQ